MNMQGIKIGRVLPGTSPQVVASAMGGRVSVLDGDTGLIVSESKDYGLGGMALALADLTGDGLDEVIFASLYSPIDGANGGTVRSHVHVFTGASGQLIELPGTNGVPVGITTNDDFLGYGACGIAVFDDPVVPGTKRILITTLNGELVVFGHNNGVIDPNAIFRTVVNGSLGGYNSIVIANLDPNPPGGAKPEVYIGSSGGVRRFDFQ